MSDKGPTEQQPDESHPNRMRPERTLAGRNVDSYCYCAVLGGCGCAVDLAQSESEAAPELTKLTNRIKLLDSDMWRFVRGTEYCRSLESHAVFGTCPFRPARGKRGPSHRHCSTGRSRTRLCSALLCARCTLDLHSIGQLYRCQHGPQVGRQAGAHRTWFPCIYLRVITGYLLLRKVGPQRYRTTVLRKGTSTSTVLLSCCLFLILGTARASCPHLGQG